MPSKHFQNIFFDLEKGRGMSLECDGGDTSRFSVGAVDAEVDEDWNLLLIGCCCCHVFLGELKV